MEPINPYESPSIPEDDGSVRPVSTQAALHSLSLESHYLARWLLVAAYMTGIPGGFALVGSVLLLTVSLADRAITAIIGFLLTWLTIQLTTTRSVIRRFDRRADITLATLVVRQLSQLFLIGFILLLMALVAIVVLLLNLVTF